MSVHPLTYPGGKQYKVTDSDVIVANTLPIEVGEKIKLEKVGDDDDDEDDDDDDHDDHDDDDDDASSSPQVLLLGSKQFTVIGTPLIEFVIITIHPHPFACKYVESSSHDLPTRAVKVQPRRCKATNYTIHTDDVIAARC
jgi:ribosomal protein L21